MASRSSSLTILQTFKSIERFGTTKNVCCVGQWQLEFLHLPSHCFFDFSWPLQQPDFPFELLKDEVFSCFGYEAHEYERTGLIRNPKTNTSDMYLLNAIGLSTQIQKKYFMRYQQQINQDHQGLFSSFRKESSIPKLVVDKNHQRYNHARQQKHKLGCRYDTQCFSHYRVAIGEQQQK